MQTRKVILLAEDELPIRTFVHKMLQEEGYEVFEAENGDKAVRISKAYKGTIDLMLTDVEMPQLDGVSAYQQISADRKNMKVLFISGGTLHSELPEFWPFLSKPFQLSELLARVHELLRDAQPSDGDGKYVILVVDQDELRKARTKTILMEGGYRILTAGDVREAEAVADSTAKIDLIISEVVFSGDSGVELAEHESSERNIGTLLISHFHPDVLKMVPGFTRQTEFLANPFTSEELLTRVRQMLALRRNIVQ